MHTAEPALAAQPPRPWYREPLMWLVVTIPALTVVAGLTTVIIAHRTKDAVVADDYRKDGLAINRDPSRDIEAARLGVGAQLTLAGGMLVVSLEATGAARPARVVVLLSHATRAELDRMVTLEPIGAGRYGATFGALPAGHWYVEVSPQSRSWRLTGEFVDQPGTLTMRPRRSP
jgi:hypothetical protein